MFQLDAKEFEKRQGRLGRDKKASLCFHRTRNCSVLHSETAIQVNIQIIRVYTKIRQLLINYKDLWIKLEKMEKDMIKKDVEINAIFKILKQLLVQEEKPREPIGFRIPKKKTT